MATQPHRPGIGLRGQAAVALVLTTVGGFVDGTGYLLLERVLTGNMSGNSVSVAQRAILREPGAFQHGWAILCFVIGLVLSDVLRELVERRGSRSTACLPLGLEAALLLASAALGLHGRGAPTLLLLAMVASAMGLQNATLSQVGKVSVRTTHVTGLLATFARAATRSAFCRAEEDARQEAILTGGMWLCFTLGAALAAVLSTWGWAVLAVPLAVLVPLALLDLARPITRPRVPPSP